MTNLLVPRNLEGRKEKLKQMNIKMLSQEVIDGDLKLDESFMDIDAKFIKLKKVNGDVWLTGGQWTEIPAWLKDVEISKHFCCINNQLTLMKNCPKNIEGNINCSYNSLISLEGCPENVEGNINCSYNSLISLEGCPENVEGNFWCSHNQLTSLEGCPKNIGWVFDCSYNQLESLKGCPDNIGGKFYSYGNKYKLELPDYVKLKGEFKNKINRL